MDSATQVVRKAEAIPWYRAVTPYQRKTLLAAWIGWMMDSMTTVMFTIALPFMMRDLKMSPSVGGAMMSLTLASAAAGGLIFGVIADKVGRIKAMILGILVYSVCTVACGFAYTVFALAVMRFILGFGMGGEYASCAALLTETWSPEHRNKAMGLMHTGWGIGYALAAMITALVMPRFGWRAVFFVAVVPILVTLWIRYGIPEPDIWKAAKLRRQTEEPKFKTRDLFRPPLGRFALILSVMTTCTLFGYWGLFTWLPTFLARPVAQGGAGLSIVKTSLFIILMQVGMIAGSVGFGFISDKLGRRFTYSSFLVIAAVVIPIYASTRNLALLLVIGPFLAFFGNGHFAGIGAMSAELFPTEIRATAQGFTYNIGRLGSFLAPILVGYLAQRHSFTFAFLSSSITYLIAAGTVRLLPETKGTVLH